MTAFLFPGQGSQNPGMGKDYYEHSTPARAVFDTGEQILGAGFLERMFNGDEDTLRDTRNAQPALVLTGIAIAAHLEQAGLKPDLCAGHSVGEISALAVAGVLTTEDALRIIVERARLMAEEAPAGSMAAVMGLAPDAISAALPAGAEVANFNGPQQTIIAGPEEALTQAEVDLKAAGAKRVIRLNVSGPFHSSAMRRPAELFTEFLTGVTFNPPACSFVSSVSAQPENDPDRIRALLGEQLYSPVRWTETQQAIGEVEALELGPGNVLQGISKRTPGAPTVTPAGTLEQVAAFLEATPNQTT